MKTPANPTKYTFYVRCNAGNVPVSNEAFAQFTAQFFAPQLSPHAGFNIFDYKVDSRVSIFGNLTVVPPNHFKDIIPKNSVLTVEIMSEQDQDKDRLFFLTKEQAVQGSIQSPFTPATSHITQSIINLTAIHTAPCRSDT